MKGFFKHFKSIWLISVALGLCIVVGSLAADREGSADGQLETLFALTEARLVIEIQSIDAAAINSGTGEVREFFKYEIRALTEDGIPLAVVRDEKPGRAVAKLLRELVERGLP